MRAISGWAVLAGIFASLAACSNGRGGGALVNHEGDDPGECSDGADNDTDGFFDCDDNDCARSPSCDIRTDAGGLVVRTDAGTQRDAGQSGPPAVAAHLRSYTIDYTYAMDFDDRFESALSTYGFSDCESHYRGSGTQVEAYDKRVTFEGPWTLVSTTCAAALTNPADVIWYNDTTNRAYASFYFSADMTDAEKWFEHRDATDYVELEHPSQQGQFYISAMYAPFDNATTFAFDHTEQETTTLDIVPLTTTHTVHTTFSTDSVD